MATRSNKRAAATGGTSTPGGSSGRHRSAAYGSSSARGKSPHKSKSPHRSHHGGASSFVPQTRRTEFRSVLRIRPPLADEERSEPVLLSRDDCYICDEVGDSSGGGGQSGAAAAILRRPTSDTDGRESSNDNNHSKAGGSGIGHKASSTLQYGMSMLRPTGNGIGGSASPMGRLATLRHGGSKPSSVSADQQDTTTGAGDDVGVSYRFDSVLTGDADQDATYQSVGRTAARDATEPLRSSSHARKSPKSKSKSNANAKIANEHVIFALGTSRSGKTHTAIGPGGESSGSTGTQGLVPRLIDDLFRQYDADPQVFSANAHAHASTKASSLTYAVRLTMVHVHGSKVYDMLSTSIAEAGKDLPKNGSSVKKMVATMEGGPGGDIQEVRLVKSSRTGLFRADANVETCREFLEAQETLYDGLDEVVVDGQSDTIKRSRGHTLITLQPVLVDDISGSAKGGGDGVVKVEGGRITVVDLAVHEPAGSGGSSRRAVAAGGSSSSSSAASAKNETVTALLECLGTIQKQQGDGLSTGSMSSQDVAYRETKLTMLLQPLFSNGKGIEERKTVVTLLVAAHSGGKDYHEKKTLLSAVESLRGFSSSSDASMASSTPHSSRVKTTANMEMATPPRVPRASMTPRASNTKLESKAMTAASVRSPLPPTHPQSAKKRDNPFALTDSTNADTPEQSVVVAAISSTSKSKSPPKSKSPKKKKGKSKTKGDRDGGDGEGHTRSPVNSTASASWLDLSREAPVVNASHTSGSVSATASESYSKKIKGFVERSPLRKVGHAVSGVSSSITGTGGAGAKRLRMVGSKDEDDNMTTEQQRKVARKLEKDGIRLQDRIMHLEEDNASLQRKNDSLEQKCEGLMQENGNLVRLLEETKRKAYRSGLQEHAEQEVVKEEAEREARIRDQSLIKSPLMNHIKQVMGTSDEQMAWQLSTKAPYALHIPQQEEWTCTDLYSHQKDNVITKMGVALASKVDPSELASAKKEKSEEEAMDIF